MKNILIVISMTIFIACNDRKINEPKQKIGNFDMEALRYKDGYLTIKIKNSLKSSFAYASQMLITAKDAIPYEEIRMSFVDSSTIKVLVGSKLSLFQLIDGRDGIKLKLEGSCYVEGLFKVY